MSRAWCFLFLYARDARCGVGQRHGRAFRQEELKDEDYDGTVEDVDDDDKTPLLGAGGEEEEKFSRSCGLKAIR